MNSELWIQRIVTYDSNCLRYKFNKKPETEYAKFPARITITNEDSLKQRGNVLASLHWPFFPYFFSAENLFYKGDFHTEEKVKLCRYDYLARLFLFVTLQGAQHD